MASCRICAHLLRPVQSFGLMPIANGFLEQHAFASETFFELATGWCPQCSLFQLLETPDKSVLFHAEYPFFSQSSRRMCEHFAALAKQIQTQYLSDPDQLVVELGSNDGVLLRHFAATGQRHVGVEPSANVAQLAIDNGINTHQGFFDATTAQTLKQQYGLAKVITASNVMCHLAEFQSVLAGLASLLAPDGVIIFEDPYLGDVIQKTAFDQIYDEHVFLFSCHSVDNIFRTQGLHLIDCIAQPTHGGSMRYVIGRPEAYRPSPRVLAQKRREWELGLHEYQTYLDFKHNCEQTRQAFHNLLADCYRRQRRVVGYAATSKSTTLLNYCQISPDWLEFIADTTPLKHGKYSPGVHIPIRPVSEFHANYPDYAVLLAWNHAQEILAKEQAFTDAGGKWIQFVPKVAIMEPSTSER